MMDDLRIALNLLWLRPGTVGGTESYARRLVRSATNERSDYSFDLYGSPNACAAIAAAGERVRHVEVDVPSQRARRVMLERRQLADRLDPATNLIHHPGGTVPFSSAAPTVVTVHDLQPIVHPENFGQVKARFLAHAIPEALERADVVTTPSAWVADDIAERFDISRDRVIPVSGFADPVDLSAPVSPSPRIANLLSRGPTLFYPAMTMAHKNHRFLFDAFRAAKREQTDLQLVCVGSVGRDHGDIVDAASAASASIHLLGHVASTDVRALYARSEALVFPSRYEGFGLPILEAQSAELPVIASNAAAICEVAGDGATLLDPDDYDAWAHAMLHRPVGEERAKVVAAGLANSARYTAASMAAQLGQAYQQACS